MRAILLAAGYGTRLQPLTNTTPKCLMLIGGKPLLQIWLERLDEVGVNHFLINTHYLSDQVNEFVENSPFRSQITLVHEPKLLGTAGTLIHNSNFYQGSDGMLIHADNYCLADFNAFVKAHYNRPKDCLLTMMTFRTLSPSSCGIVVLNNCNVVIQFYEKSKSPPGNLANGAIYLLSAKLVNKIKLNYGRMTDFSTQVLPQIINKIFTYETHLPLIDIGSMKTYQQALTIANKFSNINMAKKDEGGIYRPEKRTKQS